MKDSAPGENGSRLAFTKEAPKEMLNILLQKAIDMGSI